MLHTGPARQAQFAINGASPGDAEPAPNRSAKPRANRRSYFESEHVAVGNANCGAVTGADSDSDARSNIEPDVATHAGPIRCTESPSIGCAVAFAIARAVGVTDSHSDAVTKP